MPWRSVITTYDAQIWRVLEVWVNWDLVAFLKPGHRTGGGINVFNITPPTAGRSGLWMSRSATSFTRSRAMVIKEQQQPYELFTTVAYKNPVVTPSLSVYYDYRDVGGSFLEDNPLKDLYIRAALDKSVPITERLRAGGCVLLGAGTSRYNAVRYKSPGEGFADYQTSLFLSYAVTENFSAGATLAYTGLIGGAWGSTAAPVRRTRSCGAA